MTQYRDQPFYNQYQYQANDNAEPICIQYSYTVPKSFEFDQELVDL